MQQPSKDCRKAAVADLLVDTDAEEGDDEVAHESIAAALEAKRQLKRKRRAGSAAAAATASLTPAPAAVPAVNPATAFNINLVRIGNTTTEYDAYFLGAKERWERVIVGDVSDIPNGFAPDGGWFSTFFDGAPPYTAAVDDIVIGYQVRPIDGPGKSNGRTAVLRYRSGDFGSFPISAGIVLDVEDLGTMLTRDNLQDVILHEMGHALGFAGRMWSKYASGCGASCNVWDADAPDGCRASQLYQDMGLPGDLQLHYVGGQGDAQYCSHWFEDQQNDNVLSQDLMSPWVRAGHNPLSAITIGAFEDIGYKVSYDTAEPLDFGAADWPGGRRLDTVRWQTESDFIPQVFEM